MIVDAHTHAGLNWFEPVEMLLHQMNYIKVPGLGELANRPTRLPVNCMVFWSIPRLRKTILNG